MITLELSAAGGDSIRSGRGDESEELEPAYVNIARRAVFEDRGTVGLRTGCRVSFFTDAADAIAVRLLARVSGRCADANRRGEVDATVATVSVAGTGTALEDDVVDCTDVTTERESAVSEDTTIVDVTVVDG